MSNIAVPLSGKASQLNQQGFRLNNLGQFKEALEKFQAASAHAPNNPVILNNQGYALMSLGQLNPSIDCFFKAIKANSNYAPSYLNYGNSLFAQQKYAQAIDMYDKALSLKNTSEAFISKGSALIKLGKYEQALNSLHQAVELSYGTNKMAYTFIGDCFQCLGRCQDALTSFNKALKLDAGYYSALCGKCVCLAKMDRLNEALEICSEAIKSQPENTAAYHNKVMILNLLKKTNDKDFSTCQNMIKALAMKPKCPEDFSKLAMLLNKVGRYSLALQAADNGLRIDPKGIYSLHRNKALSLFKLDRHEQALMAINWCLDLVPDNPSVLATRVMIYFALDDQVVAIKDISSILNMFNTGKRTGFWRKTVDEIAEVLARVLSCLSYLKQNPDSSLKQNVIDFVKNILFDAVYNQSSAQQVRGMVQLQCKVRKKPVPANSFLTIAQD